MHNKFLIFSDKPIPSNACTDDFDFSTVWTGSYNVTRNATYSLENSVVMRSKEVAAAYYEEYCQIFLLSEKLDWECDWMVPEFRIGT
jgi:phosphatidylserine/phosphatidylglycerophosphate/cardiolipin synthase-like enzyme